MTNASKLAANQANARQSTGPKSAAGKQRFSQNARQHGLSIPILADPTRVAEITAIAKTIAGEGAAPFLLELAQEIAVAQLDILRVRLAREQLIAHGLTDVGFEPKEDRIRRERIYRLRGKIHPASFQRLKAAVDQRPAYDAMTKQAQVHSALSAELANLERYERRVIAPAQSDPRV